MIDRFSPLRWNIFILTNMNTFAILSIIMEIDVILDNWRKKEFHKFGRSYGAPLHRAMSV